MSKKTTKKTSVKAVKVAGAVSKSEAKRVKSQQAEEFTHIDRSNGQLLKKSQLNPAKPWIGPVSNQATVEELTQEEKDSNSQVNQ